MSLFYTKYLKYKNKYFSLKNQFGGAKGAEEIPCQKWSAAVCMCPECAPERYKPSNLSKDFSDLLKSKIKKRHDIGKPSEPIEPIEPSYLINLPDRDIFSYIIEILGDFSSNMNILLSNSNLANNFNFNLLHSKIDSKFYFEPIILKLKSIRLSLFKNLATMPEKQIIANLYVHKIRLIKIYNKLTTDKQKRKVVGRINFDQKLIYHLLMKSIIFQCKTEEEREYLRSNQDFLTSLLPPTWVIKKIHKDMFLGYLPKDSKIKNPYTGAIEMNLSTINIPNSVEIIMDEAFVNIQLDGVTIPNNVKYIGEYAFHMNNLNKIIIPDSVTHIGIGAFSKNVLTELYISNSVSEIEMHTFSNNDLERVIIPPSVTSIGIAAFEFNQLQRVTIPPSVISIGRSAFAWNESISKDDFPDKFKEDDSIFN